ncbi:MAG: polymerase III, subunit gamma and tau protein [Candidatus Magasanikbacteria bacterium GW2011_GWA2_46_17]|uniref:DNA polymerase III subunit gamma/tau n=1 Tax=Candidatus Magasanikbacteria bacterium GW2011_GWA2_46_17 TaxID=1619042 RepID=A0A0G1NZR1_9BACT|nr:MAG: polymerase III, subunit gamma and tau protein [Candidatus Magasanikbacteria bacterium GW2011_GWA2_46_17]
MTTLYRKYRPQSFSDVTGQEHVVRTITNQIATDKVAHAYLFSGPRGVGKTTIARLLAKAMNCEKKKAEYFEPCNECSSCQEISAGRNIDVIEIDAASHTGVDNVREDIIENAQFKPTKSKHKVFIIDEVHMLSTNAFNALLKTLEEPPAHIIFVLATTELHKLPATIISRCQRFGFKKISYDEMKKRLERITKTEKIKVDKKVIDRVINKSDGALRDAESLLGQILSLGVKEVTPEDAEMILPTSDSGAIIDFIENIIKKDTKSALTIIEDLSEEGLNIDQFFYDVIEVLRGMMMAQAERKKMLEESYNDANVKRIIKLSKEISSTKLISMIESAITKRRDTKNSPIPQLPLELFVVEHTSVDIANDHKSPPRDGAGGSIASSPYPAAAGPRSGGGEEGEARRGLPSGEDTTVSAKDGKPPLNPSLERRGGSSEDSHPPKKHPITESIKSTISHLTHRHQIKTTFEEARAKWPDFVKRVTDENHSLSFILKMSDLKSLDETGVHLTVPYSFHKDKLEESKNRNTVNKHIQETFSEKIPFTCEIAPTETAPPTVSDDTEIKNLATEFGGEIIE